MLATFIVVTTGCQMSTRKKSKAAITPRVSEPLGLYEAKTRLSELVDEAALGREFVIAKSGKPMARLVPFGPANARTLRKPGKGKGRVWMARDFDAPLAPDVLRLFTGVDVGIGGGAGDDE